MTAKKTPKRHRWQRLLNAAFRTIVVLVLCVGAYAYWLYRQTQQVPEFYRAATTAPPKMMVAASKKLDEQVKQLSHRTTRYGTWSAEFSEAEINAWLINRLPTEFPGVLPSGVSNPRIALMADQILLAAKFENSKIATVVSCEVSVALGESRNAVLLQIEKIKAGALSLPSSRIGEYLERPLQYAPVSLELESMENGVIQLRLMVPETIPDSPYKPVVIEDVWIEADKLVITGRTGPESVGKGETPE